MNRVPRSSIALWIALRLGVLGILLSSIMVRSMAAESPARFLSVTNWKATFTRTLHSSGSYSHPAICDVQWNFSHNGTIHTELRSLFDTWSDILSTNRQLSFSLHDRSSQTCNDTTETYEADVGAGTQVGNWAELKINVQQTNYTLSFGYLISPVKGTVNGDPFPDSLVMWHPPLTNELAEPLPESGMVLQGQRTFLLRELDYGQMAPILTIAAAATPIGIDPSKVTGEINLTWTLRPEEEEVEAIIEIEDYAAWRPKGALNENTAAEQLPIQIRLQRRDGQIPQTKVKKFILELSDVSKEPGVCMNFPLTSRPTQGGSDPKPDLRFEADFNRDKWKPLDENESKIETLDQEGPAEIGYLSTFDWGAYAVLKGKAILEDDREITAHLLGEPDTTEIYLPKRKPESYIAEVWLKGDSANKPHDADDETKPEGDGDAGDGLTLYEEYRGFYVDGAGEDHHVSGNPQVKDFFVVNRIGESDGFATFSAGSELRVISRLKDGELGTDRVINFNFGSRTPHRVNQHAVIIQRANVSGGIGEAVGGPGLPKHVQYIAIKRGYDLESAGFVNRGGTQRSTAYGVATVAHELGHCVNIYHHGEQQITGIEWASVRVDGALVWQENGATIAVLHDPSRTPYIPEREGIHFFNLVLGVKGGLGSGSEDCFMRYENHAHIWSGGGPVRYFITGDRDELAGTSLCTTKNGSGVNAAKAGTPWPRYGDATIGRCATRICVNDAMNHTPRNPVP